MPGASHLAREPSAAAALAELIGGLAAGKEKETASAETGGVSFWELAEWLTGFFVEGARLE